MFSAFIVYFIIVISFVVFSRFMRIQKKSFAKIILGYIVPMFIVCVFIGGRYEVGTDWESYKEYYDDALKNYYSIHDIFNPILEPLYMLLNVIVASFKLGTSYFFAVIALIQFSSIYLLYKHKKELLPFAFLFYILGYLFVDMNIIRQSLAMSFMLISLNYLNRKLIFLSYLFISVGFHYSAIILLPIIFIDKKIFKILDNTYLVVVLYLLTIIVAQYLVNYVSGYIQMIDFGAKYSKNADNLDSEMAISSGYGIIAKHLLNLLLVLLWNKIRHYTKDEFYSNAYRITIIGFLIANIFGVSVFLSRLALYYTVFSFIIWTYITYIIFNCKHLANMKPIILMVIVFNIAMFCMGIINGSGGCSPYSFSWIG